MINFNKFIIVQRNRQGVWNIESDRGDKYLTQQMSSQLGYTGNTLIGDWMKNQYPCDLRSWQKDIMIGEFSRALGDTDVELFTIYKSGQGYNQNHDMCLVHYPKSEIWLLSTKFHFWIIASDSGMIQFKIDESLGAIEKPETRKKIYAICEQLEKELAYEKD